MVPSTSGYQLVRKRPSAVVGGCGASAEFRSCGSARCAARALRGEAYPIDPARRLLGQPPGIPVVLEGLADGPGLVPQLGLQGVAEEVTVACAAGAR